MDFGKALLATRPVPAAALAPWVRAVSGAVFVSFGLGKFIAHAAEVRAFDRYGLPAPGLVTYVIGVLEVVSGAMLIAGLLTRLVALLMAGNMAVAIALSGVIEGEVVPSLTLAPLLLAGMLLVLWVGPGKPAVDSRRFSP